MSPYRVHGSFTKVEKDLDFGQAAAYFSLTHSCAPWLPAIEPPRWTLFLRCRAYPDDTQAVSFEASRAAKVDPILVLLLKVPRKDP